MDLLKAVNAILPKLGEHPVTSLDSRSPTLGIILPEIDAQIDLLLTPGWWFNKFEDVDLFPNSEGQIDVPEDTLDFVPNAQYDDIVQRDELFYNGKTRSFVFPVGSKITGTLTQRLGFEQLPEPAANFVLYSALITIYATDIGLEQVVQLWRQYAQQAQANMEQAHLRHRRYTIKSSRRYMKLRRAMRG